MANYRLNKAGFRAIRSAPGVVADLERRAGNIADACNSGAGLEDGYRTSSMEGAARPYGRHRTTVITATYDAIEDNAETQRLVREFNSAGRR